MPHLRPGSGINRHKYKRLMAAQLDSDRADHRLGYKQGGKGGWNACTDRTKEG